MCEAAKPLLAANGYPWDDWESYNDGRAWASIAHWIDWKLAESEDPKEWDEWAADVPDDLVIKGPFEPCRLDGSGGKSSLETKV